MKTLSILHNLIGAEFIQNNETCILIEVIDEVPSLVFQCNSTKTIQCNQHGNAHRKSLPTYTINCLNEFKTDLHPVLKNLIPETQHQQLLNTLIKK